jgi:hypothetical protein
MESTLRTIAPCDAIKVIQPRHVYSSKKEKKTQTEELLAKLRHYSYKLLIFTTLKRLLFFRKFFRSCYNTIQ